MNRVFGVILGVSTILFIWGENFVSTDFVISLTRPSSEAQVQLQPTQFQLTQSHGAEMTLERLENILQNQDDVANLQAQAGQLQFTLDDRSMVVLSNEENDRMRILTPVISANRLTPQQVQNILIANFHTTLDARYAVTDRTLVSVFVHRLSSLQDNDFRSALYQVANLAESFGTTYSSGELIFGPNGQPQPQSPEIDGDLEI
ncbi:MAG: hypothetical protein ACFE0I_22295 [Elainellaceae cyanobacterium]